jgi:hypothetical protein
VSTRSGGPYPCWTTAFMVEVAGSMAGLLVPKSPVGALISAPWFVRCKSYGVRYPYSVRLSRRIRVRRSPIRASGHRVAACRGNQDRRPPPSSRVSTA